MTVDFTALDLDKNKVVSSEDLIKFALEGKFKKSDLDAIRQDPKEAIAYLKENLTKCGLKLEEGAAEGFALVANNFELPTAPATKKSHSNGR